MTGLHTYLKPRTKRASHTAIRPPVSSRAYTLSDSFSVLRPPLILFRVGGVLIVLVFLPFYIFNILINPNLCRGVASNSQGRGYRSSDREVFCIRTVLTNHIPHTSPTICWCGTFGLKSWIPILDTYFGSLYAL